MQTFVFPSIAQNIEQFFQEREQSAQFDLEHGKFAVGEVCNIERIGGIRTINSGPDNGHWRALFQTAILRSGFKMATLVMGAPKSRLAILREQLPVPFVIKAKDNLGQDCSVTITDLKIVPEATGHALAFQAALQEEVMVVSIGFGTIEVGAADNHGVISATLESFELGTQVVADEVMIRLLAKGAKLKVGKDQLHYFDDIVRDVHDGKKRDFAKRSGDGIITSDEVSNIVNECLNEYAKQIVIPLRSHLSKFRDRRFKLILTGGGTLYKQVMAELTKMAINENYDPVDIDDESRTKSAVIGYREIGTLLFENQNLIALDLGNHTTLAFYLNTTENTKEVN